MVGISTIDIQSKMELFQKFLKQNSNRTMTIEIKGSGNATEIIANNWGNLPVNIPLDLYLRTSTVNCTAHGYRYGKYGMFEILSIERSMCGWLYRYLDEYTFYANSMIK